MFATPAFLRRFRLTRRWSFSLLRRYAEAFKPRYTVERRMGVWLLLDQINKVDLHLLCGGVWEADRLACLARLTREHRQGRRAVLLDIGAHGGLYSLALDARVTFDRIVAFEPEPASLAQIHANALMNNLSEKMTIVAKAVSDAPGLAAFAVAHDSNRGQSRIAEAEARPRERKIQVQVTTIDDEFHEKDVLVVAKIDVEGNENRVISGMKQCLQNNAVILQIEKNSQDISTLDSLLMSLGARRVHAIGQDYYYVKP